MLNFINDVEQIHRKETGMMEFDYSELRGRIISKFGTCTRFAMAMDMDSAWLSAKLNHRNFNTKEIVKAVELLEIPQDEIGRYFFTYKVQNVELGGGK